MIKGLKVSHSS